MLPIRREALSWILLFLSLFAITSESNASSEERVVYYYTNWSIYRPGTAKFSPQNINPFLCTHLIYAFGGFTKDNTLKPFDKYQDIEKGGYDKFTGLKSYNKNLKTMLAIGGWNEGSSRFSSMVASAERRREFVKNTVKFLRQNHFDGLDLDWEYPAFRDGGKPRDRDNYAQFVQELREEFEREAEKTGRPRLLLTMAVPAGVEYIKKGYDIPKLNKYLDWFNLLTYDYHSAFEPSVNHHAPLYSLEEASEYNFDTELNIDYSVKFYINEGADRNKIVLGIPTYGRSYTLLNEESTDIGAPTDGPGAQGDATREKGYLAYYEICQGIQSDDAWTVVQPNPKTVGPYAFKENQWVGYDDEAIARKKGEYVVANGLGGIMIWSIDNDYFRGTCHGRPYPIIEAAKEAMLQQIGGNENEVIAAAKPSRRKPSRSRSRTNSNSKTNSLSGQTEEKAVSTRRPSTRRSKPTQSAIVKEAVQYSSARTTTPPPPTTPNPGSDFKCEDEGFYPHPRDCKKYFWCLDSGPSNLGIVAHQFTCPSGLVFNKETDSCDYTRNVICKTKAASTTESATTESTTKVQASSAKSIFIGRPSTTTTTTTTTTTLAPEEYDDEEDEEYEDEIIEDDNKDVHKKFEHALDEEDPEVIKDLITLIKRVGGLDELEKQLQMRLNLNQNSPVVNAELKSTTTTTISPISQSLYNKVLDTKRGVVRTKLEHTTPLIQRQNKENRYSAVIRNSRPRPQNDGIDKLPETESGVPVRERPQYTTITRTQAPKASNAQIEEDDSDVQQYSVTEETDDVEDDSPKTVTTQQPSFQYVNIQRQRPSTSSTTEISAEIEEDEEDSDVNTKPTTTTRMQYVNIQRIRPTKQQFLQDIADSEAATPETNKYKSVNRKRPISTETSIVQEEDKSEEQQQRYTTVESVNNQYITNTSETTTRTYGSLSRRRTTTQTEQYSTPSSSSYSLPSTVTTAPLSSSNDDTNTHYSQFTTQYNNNNNNNYNYNLGTNSELTTDLTPSVVVDSDQNQYESEVTTASTTTTNPSLTSVYNNDVQFNVNDNKKTDTLTQTNLPQLTSTISKFSFSSINTDTNLNSLTNSNHNNNNQEKTDATTTDDQLFVSKLTTTPILPNEYPSIPTVTPSSIVVSNGRRPVENVNLTFGSQTLSTSTQFNQIETSTMFKPFISGTASSPRPFSFSKRTRPTTTTTTELPSFTTTTFATNVDSNDAKVRPQYRPGFRRPPPLQKKSKPTQSNDISDTTESSTPVSTRKSTNTSYTRRRSRPTYIPTTSHTTVAAIASTVANRNNDTIVNKILQRRKFGRPSSAANNNNNNNNDNSNGSNTNERKRFSSTQSKIQRTTTEPALTTERTTRPPNPLFRRRFGYTSTTPKPSKQTTQIPIEAFVTEKLETGRNSDQELESSILENKFSHGRFNQIDLGDTISEGLAEAITTISRAPLPFAGASTTILNVKITTPVSFKFDDATEYQISKRADSLNSSKKSAQLTSSTFLPVIPTEGPQIFITTSETDTDNHARPSRDFKRTQRVNRHFNPSNRNNNNLNLEAFTKTSTLKDKPKKISFRPAADYDYYDDGDSIIGKSTSKVKVILHEAGIIECLDQGNFPHPLSCRKFISCAKMEIGGVVGWEYTCPKGLSYDPVGGICNWAAGLGCKE